MGFMKRVYVDEIQDVYGDIGILQCDPVKILLRDNATPYSVWGHDIGTLPVWLPHYADGYLAVIWLVDTSVVLLPAFICKY